MSIVLSIPCPLCHAADLERTGVLEYFCARMHGAFRLRGTLDAATGLFIGWLEHVTTGLHYDLGMFAPTEWERLASPGPAAGASGG